MQELATIGAALLQDHPEWMYIVQMRIIPFLPVAVDATTYRVTFGLDAEGYLRVEGEKEVIYADGFDKLISKAFGFDMGD